MILVFESYVINYEEDLADGVPPVSRFFLSIT